MGPVQPQAAVDAAAAAPAVAVAEAPLRPETTVIIVEHLASTHGVADYAVGAGMVDALDASGRQVDFNGDPQAFGIQWIAVGGRLIRIGDEFFRECISMTIQYRHVWIHVGGDR